MTMPTIAWDVDDVLNDLMHSWLHESWLVRHPECRLRYEDLTENPPFRILGVPLSDYLASLDAYRLSGRYAQLPPRPNVLAWFEAHGTECRHVALTAVPLQAAPVSAEWVLRHFGRWIRSVHVVPSPRPRESLPHYDETKEAFLRRTGAATLLIDDNPENIEGARCAGVKALLFPCPWNHPTMEVVQVLEGILRLARPS